MPRYNVKYTKSTGGDGELTVIAQNKSHAGTVAKQKLADNEFICVIQEITLVEEKK